MDSGLQDLLSAVGLANEKLKDNSVAVKELTQQQQQSAEAQDAALVQSTKDDQIIQGAQLLAAKKVESQVNKFASDLGVNPEKSNEILTTLATDWRTSTLNAKDKIDKLEKDLSINFFEHPGAFIKAQIGMDQTIKVADAAIKHRDSTYNALSQAQEMTQKSVAEFNALKSTVSDATMEATLDKATQAMEGQRAALRMQNAGIQMDGLRTLNSMDIQQVNNINTAFSAKNQAEALSMQRDHLNLAKVNAEQAAEEFKQRMADKKATKQDIADIATTVRVGAAAAGFKDVTAMSDSKIVQMVNMKADGFMEFLRAGMKTQSTGGEPIVSENAGEAAKIVAVNGAPLRPEQASIKKFFNKIWQDAASPEGGMVGKYDHTKLDQVMGGAAKLAKTGAERMLKNIDPQDGTNIYAAPPLKSVLEVPALKNSPWYNIVMKKQNEAGGLNEFNSEQLTGMTANAVKNKDISFKDAAEGLQAAHSSAARLNNATKNYKGLGLPEQGSFNIQMPSPLGFTRNYNMTTSQDVNRALMSRLGEGRMYPIDGTNPFRN